MKIRHKILIYFSISVISLCLISLGIIYAIFYGYREEEFQQRLHGKMDITLHLFNKYKDNSPAVASWIELQDIHDVIDEKMLIFNDAKELIYSSIDNLSIDSYKTVLNNLSPENTWIEIKEDRYDLVGVYKQDGNKSYYAICKAFDQFGYSKLYFLRNLLIGIFIFISLIVIAISVYLSRIISRPIAELVSQISEFNVEHPQRVKLANTNTFEINELLEGFNQLIERSLQAFKVQKNTVHHISHELKTPLAVLVLELEKLEKELVTQEHKLKVQQLLEKAKNLGDIIHVLLEIARLDAGHKMVMTSIRIDELIYDVIEDMNKLHEAYLFQMEYHESIVDENMLIIEGNELLLKQAFINVFNNAIQYNSENHVAIICQIKNGELQIEISNKGEAMNAEEVALLFTPFYRAQNSTGKKGLGLGLALTQLIFQTHRGKIVYKTYGNDSNVFVIRLPLS